MLEDLKSRYDDLKQENDDLRDRIEAQDGAAIAAEAVVYENQELKSEFGLPTLSEIARVKAEVISGPPSNSGARCRRSASGPLPGRGGAAGKLSRHCSQPARAK